MHRPFPLPSPVQGEPAEILSSLGSVFAVFDRQDSGNLSYGVEIGSERFFVKTAGRPDDPAPYLPHPARVNLLRNAVRLRRRCDHPALPILHEVLEGSDFGPMLVYEWVDGELLRGGRAEVVSGHNRFRALPVEEIVAAFETVFSLHAQLAGLGYVAVDLYDGCFLYDFRTRRLRVMDLDTYHEGPFGNTMGRMFGATRFMSPEEFQLGARIDERTNVFTLGRMMAVFLSNGTFDRDPFRGSVELYQVMRRACQEAPAERFASVSDFYRAWRGAVSSTTTFIEA